ncbi:hypothetical protein KR084_005407 [Drosophila pseudotakahashii]|nr:hypothetical protein KR084_005407 [Drosophila pseudotakahashii]
MFEYATYFLYLFIVIHLHGAQKKSCPKFPWYDKEKQFGEVCLVDLPKLLKSISKNPEKDIITTVLDKVEGALENTKKKINKLEPFIERQLKKLQNALDRHGKIEKLEANLTEATRALHCALENKKVPKLGMIHPQFKRVGSRYFYVEHYVQLDWFDAAARCREMGGHLALPQSEEELRQVLGMIEARWFWIDLSDLVEVNKWRSLVTGGDPPFKLVWNKGYPKKDSSDEHCVFAFIRKLSTVQCDYRCLYICQAHV